MNKIEIPTFSDDEEKMCKEINRGSNQIKKFTKRLVEEPLSIRNDQYGRLIENIQAVLQIWCEHTYIGEHKSKRVKKNFQRFFCNLYDFLMTCRQSNDLTLKNSAKGTLYQGTVYRYLGYNYPVNNSEPIHPEYNDIYVSWSKRREFGNILTKLYGTRTLMTCCIEGNNYGIDLEAFGVSRNEYEVVFPTLKDNVTDIEYQYEEEDEDE